MERENGGDGESDQPRSENALAEPPLDGDTIPEVQGEYCAGADGDCTPLGGGILMPDASDPAANDCPADRAGDMNPDGGGGNAIRARPLDGADTDVGAPGTKLPETKGATTEPEEGTHGAATGAPATRATESVREPLAGRGPAEGEGLRSSSNDAVVRDAPLGGK